MKLIVGLGNPGKQYARTRHNVGFMVLDKLQEELQSSDWKLSKKFNAEICEYNTGDEKKILAKPMTFMNDSGQAVGLIVKFYKLKPEDVTVVHDDKDLKLGEIKIQENRGDAGHNGIRSIIEHLGTKNFTRVRVGVASENEKKMTDTGKFVLGRFGIMEKKKLKEVIQKATKQIRKSALSVNP